MTVMDEKYINPLTDFGFKRLFGTEFNKELLVSFLNTLLEDEQHVVDVTYLGAEHLGERIDSRRAIFDVYCENDKGEKFIVEMQNVFQEFFKDRTVYYSTFPIREQAKRSGDWDFHLENVYTIGILNFIFHDGGEKENTGDGSRGYKTTEVSVKYPWHHKVMLMDVDRKTVFYDKLTYIYEEIPRFNKSEEELETMFDKWMFVLRNLSRLMSRPAALQERVFTRLFEQAEIAKFDSRDLKLYEDSVNAYRDIANAIRTAEKMKFAEGKEEGRAEGIAEGRAEGMVKGADLQRVETARMMLDEGEPVEKIIRYTGLTSEDIKKLK